MRHVRFEVATRLIESLGGLRSFRRKELERKCGRIPPHDIGDMHGLGAYLRSSRDFRSTHRKNIFDHVFRSKPYGCSVFARSHQFLQIAGLRGQTAPLPSRRRRNQIQGKIANTRAGNPEPPFGFGKLATTIAPASGT